MELNWRIGLGMILVIKEGKPKKIFFKYNFNSIKRAVKDLSFDK